MWMNKLKFFNGVFLVYARWGCLPVLFSTTESRSSPCLWSGLFQSVCPVQTILMWDSNTFCMTPDAVAVGNNILGIDRLAQRSFSFWGIFLVFQIVALSSTHRRQIPKWTQAIWRWLSKGTQPVYLSPGEVLAALMSPYWPACLRSEPSVALRLPYQEPSMTNKKVM